MKSQQRLRQAQKYVLIQINMQKGYIAMVMIIMLSVVALVIATSVSLLAIGEAQSSLASYKGEESLAFVEGCMEDALLKARDSDSYAGGTITRPDGTCSIAVSKVGSVWTITATTTNMAYKRTIQVVMTKTTSITLLSNGNKLL